MFMEHDTGRGYVKNMSEAFLEYNAGNSASHKKIVRVQLSIDRFLNL
jgi:hemerythrin-like domain-containing protein